MLMSVFTSIICFAVATVMFTKYMREFPFYQALSFYFLFEGAYELINGLITLIWPGSYFMVWVHCVGVIVFSAYLLYCIYTYVKNNKSN